MRPMRLRAWDKEDGVMILPEEICRLHFNKGNPYGILLWNGNLVLKFSLMFSTGLCDASPEKKECYRGDMVDFDNAEDVGIVTWCNKTGMWVVKVSSSDPEECYEEPLWMVFKLFYGIIIGNKFQHPELPEKA